MLALLKSIKVWFITIFNKNGGQETIFKDGRGNSHFGFRGEHVRLGLRTDLPS